MCKPYMGHVQASHGACANVHAHFSPLPPLKNYAKRLVFREISRIFAAYNQQKTMQKERKDEGLEALGRETEYNSAYAPEVLETFENRHQENDYWVRFNCPEFTSLCPITGQPDFAEIRIAYVPAKRMVESKSLKLYLFSFRNHGDFHEDCVNVIMKDLIRLMDPKYIEVTGLFMPRGGISIWPYANYGKPGTKWEKLAEKRLFTRDGGEE